MIRGVALTAVFLSAGLAAAGNHCLWYGQPAEDSIAGWERQSLPLGCGHFGVSVFGEAAHERLQVTHNAVLTGRKHRSGENGNLTSALDIRIDFDIHPAEDYERGLDLEKALAWVKFRSWDNRIRREYFTSYPARTMAMRFTASEKGGLTFRIRPEIPYPVPFGAKGGDELLGRRGTVVAKDDGIAIDEELENFGVRFAGRILMDHEGGTLSASDGALVVSNADAAVVYFSCDTNYRLRPETFTLPSREKLDPKDNPGPRAAAFVAAARKKGWSALKQEHERDMVATLGRAAIDLGADPDDALIPTDGLRRAYEQGRRSRYLEETYWQYGRYLLVASSRPGTLPANLQGVWTAHKVSPWGSGYWHNINVQMNYWPAFNSNLAECFLPYAEFNAAFRPSTRRFAIDYLKAHGLGPVPADGEAADMWCVGTATYPYVICGGPGGHSGPGTGGLTTKLFADWYDFTLDRAALERYGWPVIHGMADFLARCVVETNGLFLSKFSASPEQVHGGGYYNRTIGCAFDQQMIWENNHDLLWFAEILGRTDDPVVRTVKAQIEKYDPVQIGASGQIKEFREESKYGEIGEWHHRHISQLVGLMPGTLITRATPEWLAAAKKTLDFRGDESTGWALAHRLNARARTGEGDRAYRLLGNLLGKRTFPNLWDAHPPFQIDGNFGATAGITEMLIQSHAGFIDLLPALPAAWAKEGSFRGLCARGAWEVDCRWKDGRPTEVTIRGRKGRPQPEARFRGEPVAFTFRSFESNGNVGVPAGPQLDKIQVKDGAVEIIFDAPVKVPDGWRGTNEYALFDADLTRHAATATQPWPNVFRIAADDVKRPVQVDYFGTSLPTGPFVRKASFDGLCYERFRSRTWALDEKDLIEIDSSTWPEPPKFFKVIARHDFAKAGCGRNGRDPVSDGELGVVFATDSGYWRYLPREDRFEPSTKERYEELRRPEDLSRRDDRLFFADPFVYCEKGVYYAYGTSARHGIAVATSTDLKTWKTGVGRARENLALHRRDSYGEKWFWAPEVYRRGDGKYVMYYSAEQHVCAALADSPLGPFRQVERKPMLESPAIDSSLFIDDDGTPWMTYTCWEKPGHGSGPRVIELEPDLLHVKQGAKPVFLFDASQDWEKVVDYARVNEGPFILKHEGLYYMTWSANGYENPRYAVGVATAKKVTGPWTKCRGNPILVRHGGLYGTGHHSFFRDAAGKLRIAYHAHPSRQRFDPRFMCVASASFVERDGEKTMAVGDDVIVCRAEPVRKPLGYQLDISRCKVPTMSFLKTVVDTLAKLGYTQFQLYTEHTFAYAKHEPVWRNASPMTPAEVRELDAWCAARGIELVPNQNSFGHMAPWLATPGYEDLAEMAKGAKRTETSVVTEPAVLCPTDPRSEKLVAGLYDELFPCFRSKFVNVGCDETFELDNALGTGRSAAAIAAKGWHRVYLDFLLKIHALCAARGHTMMFWGDIILHCPELISELPEDVIALNWGYEADHEFAKQTAALEESERRFVVCPGTSAWGSLFGRTTNMMGNIDNGFAAGESHGAYGYLLADWGDGGHPNPWIVSVPSLVYLAAKANEGRTLTRAELAARIDGLLGCTVGEALLGMGDVYLVSKGRSWNCAEFFHVLREGKDYKMPADVTEGTLTAALAAWDAARAKADLSKAPKWVKDDFAMLDLLKEAVAARVKDKSDPSFRATFEPRYRELWLRCNRPGGLQSSINQLFGR